MGLNANNVPSTGGKQIVKQEPMEIGSYPARLVQVLDLGLQPQRPYNGQEKPPAHEIKLTYEFLDEFCLGEDGEELLDKPRWLSEDIPFHNLSCDLAKSTKRYYALDPDESMGGDFTKLVGMPCIVTVVNTEGKGKNKGTIYNNVGVVSSMRPKDAAKAAELANPPKVFVLDEPDMEVFNSLPEWLQDKIKGNLNYNGSPLQKAIEGGNAEEKPKKAKKEAAPSEEPDEDEDW